jgi:hypothetical protein
MTHNKPLLGQSYQLGLILTLALAASFFLQLPASYSFDSFVFYDPGVALRADRLLTEGYLPSIDFGYSYGLLSLLIGRVFFTLAGRTPASYLAFMFIVQVLIVFGLSRLASGFGWKYSRFPDCSAASRHHPGLLEYHTSIGSRTDNSRPG